MANLKSQRRMAASLLRVGANRVVFRADKQSLDELKQAITRQDINKLIVKGIITAKAKAGNSSGRKKINRIQKKKGRRSGAGKKRGVSSSRTPKKRAWIIKVRNQRELIQSLKTGNKINNVSFKKLYLLIKGGFFRSKAHIKTYISDHELIIKKK